MRVVLWSLLLFACGSRAPSPDTPSHATSSTSSTSSTPETTTTPQATATAGSGDAPPGDDEGACARFDSMIERVQACSGIDPAVRDRLVQIHIDTQAAISENGLDDSFVDPDAECEEGIAIVQKEAAVCLR